MVFVPNIGRNQASFAERWGMTTNVTGSIAFARWCSAMPGMRTRSAIWNPLLAMCPLRLTVFRKADTTHVVFVKPDLMAQGTAAETLVEELEADVVRAVQQGVDVAQTGQ